MGEELTAREVLGIIGEICKIHPYCNECPFLEIRRWNGNCHQALAANVDEVVKICRKWKIEHTTIEIEWAYICRIIQEENGIKKCVYEEDVTEREDELPFEGKESAAESLLKKYCKNHKGKFFATVEHICRSKGVN